MHDLIDVTSILLVGNFVLHPISVDKVLLINMVSLSNQGWEKLIAHVEREMRVKMSKASSTMLSIYFMAHPFPDPPPYFRFSEEGFEINNSSAGNEKF